MLTTDVIIGQESTLKIIFLKKMEKRRQIYLDNIAVI